MNASPFPLASRYLRLTALVLLTFLFASATSLAQSDNTLHGTVTDATGGLVQ
jgi:hypothetical protein